MDKKQQDYIRDEIIRIEAFHRTQSRELARSPADNDDERMDNRIRSEAAWWRAGAWRALYGLIGHCADASSAQRSFERRFASRRKGNHDN